MLTEKPHLVNLYYSVFLIVIGMFAFSLRYLDQGDFQFTSLIPLFFGVVLIFFTGGIKSGNKLLSHMAVSLTLLMGIVSIVMLIIGLSKGLVVTRKTIIFLLIISASLFAVVIYIVRFRKIRSN